MIGLGKAKGCGQHTCARSLVIVPPQGEMEIGVLVADSGPFIKGAPLERWTNTVVTIRDVVAEIRDRATRERLQVLPYELTFREPSAESLQHVTRFAKKTGDYGALSSVDLKLLALTYQLHCELDPSTASELREEPLKQQAFPKRGGGRGPNIAGFYSPKSKHGKHRDGTEKAKTDDSCVGNRKECIELVEEVEELSLENGAEREVEEEKEKEKEEDKEEGIEEEIEEEDNDEGWITPDNLERVCEEMGGVLDEAPQSMRVGCITTDYAMQNVLLQMGLNLISMEGKRIRQLRTYAKKCKGCFKTTMDTSRVWCAWCGNCSLYKVSVVVGADGKMQCRVLGKKQFSHKGLRYSLPAPKSGRHAHNPVLAPDQQVTYRERRQRENKVDPLSEDYVTLTSPFAIHDVTSRGARFTGRGGGSRAVRGGSGNWRRNPNAVRPKGRRKK